MWPFSNYCKSCLFRDITIFVAGGLLYVVGNKIETGVDKGFSTSNIIGLVSVCFGFFYLLYMAWKMRNHVHKTF